MLLARAKTALALTVLGQFCEVKVTSQDQHYKHLLPKCAGRYGCNHNLTLIQPRHYFGELVIAQPGGNFNFVRLIAIFDGNKRLICFCFDSNSVTFAGSNNGCL